MSPNLEIGWNLWGFCPISCPSRPDVHRHLGAPATADVAARREVILGRLSVSAPSAFQ